MLWFFAVFKKQIWHWLSSNVSTHISVRFFESSYDLYLELVHSLQQHVCNMWTCRLRLVNFVFWNKLSVTILLLEVS